MKNDRLLHQILFALTRDNDYEKHVYEWQTLITHRLIACEQRIEALSEQLEALLTLMGDQ